MASAITGADYTIDVQTEDPAARIREIVPKGVDFSIDCTAGAGTAAMLLGIVGSFVGGLMCSLFNSDGNMMDVRPSGLLWSIIGAVVVLLLVGFAGRRRAV